MKPGAGGEEHPLFTATTGKAAVPARTIRLQGGWVWLPLSCVFLLLGTVLGFQVARSAGPKASDIPGNPYQLSLSVTAVDDTLHLRWDRDSPAILIAEGGRLLVDENGHTKEVTLDAGHLRNGSVIYRHAGTRVSFRLEVFLPDRVFISQSIDFPLAIDEGGP